MDDIVTMSENNRSALPAQHKSDKLTPEVFTNLPLPENFLERREVATKERKK